MRKCRIILTVGFLALRSSKLYQMVITFTNFLLVKNRKNKNQKTQNKKSPVKNEKNLTKEKKRKTKKKWEPEARLRVFHLFQF